MIKTFESRPDSLSGSCNGTKERSFALNENKHQENQLNQDSNYRNALLTEKDNLKRNRNWKNISFFGNGKVAPLPETRQDVDRIQPHVSGNRVVAQTDEAVAVGECSGKGTAKCGIFNYSGPLETALSNSVKSEFLNEQGSGGGSARTSPTVSIRSLDDCEMESGLVDDASTGTESSGFPALRDDVSQRSWKENSEKFTHRVIHVRPCSAVSERNTGNKDNPILITQRRVHSAKASLTGIPSKSPLEDPDAPGETKPGAVRREDSGVSLFSYGSGGSQTIQTTTDLPQPPAVYLCPLTKKVMTCPVIAPDGMTYDKEAILDWLRTRATSPLTGRRITDLTLKVDFVLLAKIQKWKLKNIDQLTRMENNRQNATRITYFHR